jgi:hypothetical protein
MFKNKYFKYLKIKLKICKNKFFNWIVELKLIILI